MPWSRLVVVNARTGQVVWESVLGVNDLLPEGKRRAGGLVFVGATNDRRFRAFDAKTGKEIGANANANPMSYQGNSGTQHVAVVAGNALVVYSL
jgi:glucose dehydrogenase